MLSPPPAPYRAFGLAPELDFPSAGGRRVRLEASPLPRPSRHLLTDAVGTFDLAKLAVQAPSHPAPRAILPDVAGRARGEGSAAWGSGDRVARC